MSQDIASACERCWRTLRAVAPALPREADLQQEIADARAAQKRGYYLPDEDERLRTVYRRYLNVRASLWQTVEELKTLLDQRHPALEDDDRHRVFGLAFCAAAMLVRSASFLITLSAQQPVVWEKLDEADAAYSIPRKTFTQIYASLSAPRRIIRYYQSWRFYEREKENIHESLKTSGMEEAANWLLREEPHFELRRRDYLKRLLRYRLHSLHRRHSSGFKKIIFHLFRLGGSAVAELHHPLPDRPADRPRPPGKRALQALDAISNLLQPGDIIVTRHDDAVSNLFLPGYWPHAALCITPAPHEHHPRILEAKKDGVLIRPLEETLAVDTLVVLRPNLDPELIKQALDRALIHAGKLYDFVFDFRKSDRLVCTEVVYRTYHGLGKIHYTLTPRSGRLTLSAEDLIKQSLESKRFEVKACYGIRDDLLRIGPSAHKRLLASLRHLGENPPIRYG